jgi:SLOG-like protein
MWRGRGAVEEALLAVRSNKLLYLAACLGGATEQVVAAIDGKDIPDDFCPPAPTDALYATPPAAEHDEATDSDRLVDRAAIWEEFRNAGPNMLVEFNGLSLDENTNSSTHLLSTGSLNWFSLDYRGSARVATTINERKVARRHFGCDAAPRRCVRIRVHIGLVAIN